MAGRRLVTRLGGTALVAVFGFLASVSGLDRASASASGLADRVPQAFGWEASRASASLAIMAQDEATALARAKTAVAKDPVNPDSTALLGAAHLMSGDAAAAAPVFRIAARFGWRNIPTQLYWFAAALQNGDHAVAADRADAVLRGYPAFPQRNAILAPLETDPAARKELLARLERGPAWMPQYLTLTDDMDAEQVARRADVLAELGSTGNGPDCDTVVPFVRGLISRSRRDSAMQVWNASCPDRKVAAEGLSDPEFAGVFAETAQPFGWSDRPSGDVYLGPGRDGGLVMRNSSRSVGRAVITQPINLRPGTYRITAEIEGDKALPDDTMFVTVDCGTQPVRPGSLQGNLTRESGQVLQLGECADARFSLWLGRDSGEVTIRSLKLDRVS